MFIIKDNSSSERYCFWFIWFPFSHFGDRNVFEWSRRITQLKFFILFSSRRHGGRTRRLCGIDLTDARSVCKTAHVGTMRPTPRSKWLRRCAFSDLCRSSAVNLPPGGGIGVRVLPASCVLVPKRDACARRRGLRCFAMTFYAAHQKSPLIRFVAPPFQNANSSLVCILVFFLVATLVAMKI